MNEINYKKKYTCMPKLNIENSPSEEIECWVPVSCWLIAKHEWFTQDGNSTINYDVIYTKNPDTLEPVEFSKELMTITKEEDEISSDYEAIKFLCCSRNRAILEEKKKSNPQNWQEVQKSFLQKEIEYFGSSIDEEVQAQVKVKK